MNASASTSLKTVFLMMVSLCAIMTVSSFQPILPATQRNSVVTNNSRLFISTNNGSSDNQNDNDDTTIAVSKKTNDEWKKELFAINNQFWDYTCNFFYVAISCGILLNLSGYGYSFTKSGLEVTSVHDIREERLFQMEDQRYEQQRSSGMKTSHQELLSSVQQQQRME